MQHEISCVADEDVTAVLDKALISLLSTCFTKPEDRIFQERRYFYEAPAHRFLCPAEGQPRDAAAKEFSELAAHLGVHDRSVAASGRNYRCGGIAEVAVAPQYRGRGLARWILNTALQWMKEHDFDFAILFGDPAVYASSDFHPAPNPVRYRDYESGKYQQRVFGQKPGTAAFMYRLLSGREWPEGTIDLQGYRF
jgi:GNAT superfamily N-acetyltransferase